MSTVCPECRKDRHVEIQNGQCVQCHDRTYTHAFGKDDPVSLSIVEEYRLTARTILAGGLNEGEG